MRPRSLWRVTRRGANRYVWLLGLLLVNVAFFFGHLMPTTRRNAAIDARYLHLSSEVNRLKREIVELRIQSHALRGDLYYVVQTMAKRRAAMTRQRTIALAPVDEEGSPP